MAQPRSTSPSARFLAAASREQERIARELNELAADRSALVCRLDELDRLHEELVERLRALETLVGRADPVEGTEASVEPIPNTLRGANIRIAAVRVFLSQRRAGSPVHYREWYELMLEEGLRAGGRNPVATFLTQIARSPLVRSTGVPGEYVIDPNFESKARRELDRLQDQLRDLGSPHAEDNEQSRTVHRDKRRHLVTRIEQVERALAEAAASWAAPNVRVA